MSDGSAGNIFYDWPNKRQRVEHFHNTAHRANQCFFWFNSTGPCTEFFTPSGEQFIYFPADGSCCLESCAQTCPASWNVSDGSCCREPPVGTPRPDSAAQCTFNSSVTFEGKPADWYSCPACLNYYFSPPSEWASMAPLLFFADDHNYAVRFDVPSLRCARPSAAPQLLLSPGARTCPQAGPAARGPLRAAALVHPLDQVPRLHQQAESHL